MSKIERESELFPVIEDMGLRLAVLMASPRIYLFDSLRSEVNAIVNVARIEMNWEEQLGVLFGMFRNLSTTQSPFSRVAITFKELAQLDRARLVMSEGVKAACEINDMDRILRAVEFFPHYPAGYRDGVTRVWS